MAGFIALPFGVKVETAWETGGGIMENVHYVSKTTPSAIVSSDLVAIATVFDTWRTALRSIQHVNTTIEGIRCTDWSAPDGITYLLNPGANLSGTNLTLAEPNNVAICATHYTGRTGRSRRGRTFIGGLAENEVSLGDLVNVTAGNAIVNAYIALRTALLAVNFVHCVASFFTGGAPRAVGLGTAVVTTYVDPYADSQRRRLAGRGA